jgi:NADH-quinone oxidoreductase subunit A
MLREYLPALVLLLLGTATALVVVNLNRLFGPRRAPRARVRAEPYESGLPSPGAPRGPFPVSFFLVGMLALVFAVEVILLYPVAVELRSFGVHALVALLVFLGVLVVALVYEWRVGALDWERQAELDLAEPAARSEDPRPARRPAPRRPTRAGWRPRPEGRTLLPSPTEEHP